MGRICKPFQDRPYEVDLQGFDGYSIDQDGRIWKKATEDGKYRKERYRVKPFGDLKSNSVRINLFRNKRRYTKVVVDLVLMAFYPAPKSRASREVFFIDKNQHNAAIDNLKVVDF